MRKFTTDRQYSEEAQAESLIHIKSERRFTTIRLARFGYKYK